MNYSVCCIYDKKTASYGPPAVVIHVGEAVREFDGLKKLPESKINKNPEDFELHHLGFWNSSSGHAENLASPITLATGV